MCTGTDYERVFKLWIRLWQLVCEGKRQLETVTALLQKLIYDQTEYPKFKNWPAICELGRVDRFMMMAVATSNPAEDSEKTKRLIAAFPECYSFELVKGPVPLSVIVLTAETNAIDRREGKPDAGDFAMTYDGTPDYIPLQNFDKFGRNVARCDDPCLPKCIPPNTPQGGRVRWENKDFIVIENNHSCEELCIAPAECIVVDL